MKTIDKKIHQKQLKKRKDFLNDRIFLRRKDLSYDKSEVAALRYVLILIEQDIGEVENGRKK